jgi:hypothetical protein
MQKQLPEEIKEARDLLAGFEKENDHSLKTGAFGEAIDILDDYLAVEPETEHKDFIENIKRTYTRKLLEGLHGLLGADMETWFQYIHLLLVKAPNEVEFNIWEHPRLDKDYQGFMEIWLDEVIKWANERAQNLKKSPSSL